MSPSIKRWLHVLGVAALASLAGSSWAQGGTGLKGQYFRAGGAMPDRTQWGVEANLLLTRLDAPVNYTWGGGSPFVGPDPAAPVVPTDGFAVRETGYLQTRGAGNYTIICRTDDGCRVWLFREADGSPTPDAGVPTTEAAINALDPAANPPSEIIDTWVERGATDSPSGSLNLKANSKYFIVAEMYENGGDASFQLRWAGPGFGDEVIPPSQLFPLKTGDTTAPSKITNLAATIAGRTATLTFSAPTDKAPGTVSSYVIGYSPVPITDDASFGRAQTTSPAVLPQAGGAQETLTVTGLDNLQNYYFAVRSTDNDLNISEVSNVVQASTAALAVPAKPATGVTYLTYPTPGANNMSTIFNHPSFPGSPDNLGYLGDGDGKNNVVTDPARYPDDNKSGDTILDLFVEAPRDWRDEFATRFLGYFKPPSTGNYVFWFEADDPGYFYLSTVDKDGDKSTDEASKAVVASVPDGQWTGKREYVKYPSQKSAVIALTAGTKYYFETLSKEGGGGDNNSVTYLKLDPGDDGSAAAPPAEPMKGAETEPFPFDLTQARVSGIIKDQNGNAVSGLTVGVTGGSAAYSTTTNASGYFSVLGRPGAGNITVSSNNPTQDVSIPATASNFEAGKINTVNITATVTTLTETEIVAANMTAKGYKQPHSAGHTLFDPAFISATFDDSSWMAVADATKGFTSAANTAPDNGGTWWERISVTLPAAIDPTKGYQIYGMNVDARLGGLWINGTPIGAHLAGNASDQTFIVPAGTFKAGANSFVFRGENGTGAMGLISTIKLAPIKPASGTIRAKAAAYNATKGYIADGITVQLVNATSSVVASTTTDSLGIAEFFNVPAGNYTIRYRGKLVDAATAGDAEGEQSVSAVVAAGSITEVSLDKTNPAIGLAYHYLLPTVGTEWLAIDGADETDTAPTKVGFTGATVANGWTSVPTLPADIRNAAIQGDAVAASFGENTKGWWRMKFKLPADFLTESDSTKAFLDQMQVDDDDTTYINGTQIGKSNGWQTPRNYTFDKSLLNATGDNVLVVLVSQGGGGYGMHERSERIRIGLLPGLGTGGPIGGTCKPGDVVANGTIDVTDAVQTLKAAVKLITLTPEQIKAADVIVGANDPAGTINVSDAVQILKAAVKLITLPATCP